MKKDSKTQFYKYITVSEQEKKLGLYLTGAGYTLVDKNSEYPLRQHPVHHYFNWKRGRKLTDYQLLYIIEGKGIFESELSGKQKINAGDVFVLFPDVWHRFAPLNSTGWKEYWIEFNGEIAEYFQKQKLLCPNSPILRLGLDENLMAGFINIQDEIRKEELTLQFKVSGIIYQILGRILSIIKFRAYENSDIEKRIRCAKLFIIENLTNPASPESVAVEVGISYSLFRKEFKRLTGFSPIQYQIQLRIQKSKNLLSSSNIPVKEIAYQLGFESNNYFSRLFKQKLGLTPQEFRLKSRRHNSSITRG